MAPPLVLPAPLRHRLLTLGTLLLPLACAAPGDAPPPPQSGPEPTLDLVELRGAEYPAELVDGGRIRLADGIYPAGGDSLGTAEVTARLADPVAFGTLRQRKPVAAVVLEVSGGGTGTFVWLYLVSRIQGVAQPIAGVLLGDRVEVTALRFVADTIEVRLVTQGPTDALCCPTLEVVRRYVREEGELREVGAKQ